MDPNQNQQPADAAKPAEQTAPNPGALSESTTSVASSSPGNPGADTTTPSGPSGGTPQKPVSGLKRLWHKINIYLLAFIFVLVVAVAITTTTYLNSKKEPSAPSIATQQITQETLDQLANSDATVGGSGQTLTVQGNAIFSGQVLVRGDVGIAGSLKLSSPLTLTDLTVSGTTNLAQTQVGNLQVAGTSITQDSATFQKDLNVAGSASFSGPISAGQIAATKLIMSGSAVLEVRNHIAFTGAPAQRGSIGGAALGAGGSASVDGSDTTGTVNINTGNGTAPGCFITINFAQRFSQTPHVLVSPIGSGAGQSQFYVNRSTTSFSICTANAAPTSQVFAFDYFVTGT